MVLVCSTGASERIKVSRLPKPHGWSSLFRARKSLVGLVEVPTEALVSTIVEDRRIRAMNSGKRDETSSFAG